MNQIVNIYKAGKKINTIYPSDVIPRKGEFLSILNEDKVSYSRSKVIGVQHIFDQHGNPTYINIHIKKEDW